MRHDTTNPGGDADLYVRAGSAPTEAAYDCRPYASGSDEDCRVTLTAPAVIHLMVRGYAARANAFVLTARPETVTPPPPAWAGFEEQGTVSRNQEVRLTTPSLPAGRYTFTMAGNGDADLYVRSGAAPTTTTYDCRPYAGDSNETCTVNLTANAVIHVMVRGYAASTSYTLSGRRE